MAAGLIQIVDYEFRVQLLGLDEGRHSPGPLCGMKNLLEARQDGVIKNKNGMEACSLQ